MGRGGVTPTKIKLKSGQSGSCFSSFYRHMAGVGGGLKTHFVDPDPPSGGPREGVSCSFRLPSGMKTLSNFCPMSFASGKEVGWGERTGVSHMEPSEETASCSFCLDWKTVSELERDSCPLWSWHMNPHHAFWGPSR